MGPPAGRVPGRMVERDGEQGEPPARCRLVAGLSGLAGLSRLSLFLVMLLEDVGRVCTRCASGHSALLRLACPSTEIKTNLRTTPLVLTISLSSV